MAGEIVFNNTEKMREENISNLTTIIQLVLELFKEKGISYNTNIWSFTDNSYSYQALFIQLSSTYGFQFTIFHGAGLEVKSVSYKDGKMDPNTIKEITTVTKNAKDERQFLTEVMPVHLFNKIWNIYQMEFDEH